MPAHPKFPQPKPSSHVGFSHGVALEHQCLVPKPVCSSRWETGETAPKQLGEPQTSLFPQFPHSVSPFESDNCSDLAPQLVGEAVGRQHGWEKVGNCTWWQQEPGTREHTSLGRAGNQEKVQPHCCSAGRASPSTAPAQGAGPLCALPSNGK